MTFKDHFSGHAAVYARARPGYPAALFDYLAAQCAARRLAWDCACGNGQASLALRGFFKQVVASDGSFQQLSQATNEAGVLYCQAVAEHRVLAAHSVDLVCVAQALHWFDLPRFYANVSEVLRPDGLFAAWSYGLHRIDRDVDEVIGSFYEDVIGPYWPEERLLVEDGYRSLPFPFQEIESPPFELRIDWSLDEVAAYLSSWSAVRRYIKQVGTDPLPELMPALREAWGSDSHKTIIWPLSLRAGRL